MTPWGQPAILKRIWHATLAGVLRVPEPCRIALNAGVLRYFCNTIHAF